MIRNLAKAPPLEKGLASHWNHVYKTAGALRARKGASSLKHEQPPEAVAHPKRGAARKRRPPIRLNHFFAHGGVALAAGAAVFVGADPSRLFAAATSFDAS